MVTAYRSDRDGTLVVLSPTANPQETEHHKTLWSGRSMVPKCYSRVGRDPAMFGYSSLWSRDMKNLQVGRDVIVARVRLKLNLSSGRHADAIVRSVIDSIADVIRENIDTEGFELKLPSFGKFVVRHKLGRLRRIPLTGRMQLTSNKRKVKFIPLSQFRDLENWSKKE